MLIVAPSILGADFARLATECDELIESGADWLHVDVMDGHFVPNLSIGFPVISSISSYYKTANKSVFLDVHMMVSEPMKWINECAKSGSSQMCFHVEVFTSLDGIRDCARQIKAAGMRVGIALKPGTSVQGYLPLLEESPCLIDMVLVMTVEPGFGGQSFMSECLEKVRVVRAARADLDIQVDGGLTDKTTALATVAGANVIVAGNFITKAASKRTSIASIRSAVLR